MLIRKNSTNITIEQINNELYDFNVSCEEVAMYRNCITVYPKDNELQIDIDSEEAYDVFNNNIEYLEFVTDIKTTLSSSGYPHRHITVSTNRTFTDIERIAFQFMLGSDFIRESLNLLRASNGIKNPIRLFEKK